MAEERNIEPWGRLENEGTKAYEAFSLYLSYGRDRSYRKVAAELQKSETLIGRWGGRYDWIKRAAAWDDEQDRIARLAQLEDIKKMRKRHAKLAYDMLEKAAKALNRLPEEEIKAVDVSRMVETASKLERISLGDVGDVIEERDGGEAISPVQIYLPDNNRGRDKDAFDDLEV